jgi:hypothetical protein
MPRVRNRNTRKHKRIFGGNHAIPTFHVVIVSGGRETLKKMIESLRDELKVGDALTIIYDGRSAKKNSGYTDEWIANMNCAVHVKEQIPGLKFFGHLTLNKYIPLLQPRTTFMMFADDDDTYVKGSFDILRRKCSDPRTLYIAKFIYSANESLIPSPGTKMIIKNNIGKPNGIVPFGDAGKAVFGTVATGDYEYYRDLQDKVAKVVFLDDIIYRVGKDIGNVSNGNVNKK